MSKVALVCGAGGFIGGHLVERLARDGYEVRAIGRRLPPRPLPTQMSWTVDLRHVARIDPLFHGVDEVYQCAGQTGGLGYIEDHANDLAILSDNLAINMSVLEACRVNRVGKVLFVSTGCVYPARVVGAARETDAYPADPLNELGWAALTCERLYSAYARHFETRIARLHSCYGPHITWRGGKERAPAAFCRKIAERRNPIEVWGDGSQLRSFTYVDDTVEGIRRLMDSSYRGPLNIGSSMMVTIDALLQAVMRVADHRAAIQYIPGPAGVPARNSDNTLCREVLGWEPATPLWEGLVPTYAWIKQQVDKAKQTV